MTDTLSPIRLLLADDHTMLREAVRRAMESAGLDVVGEAGDGEEAVRLAAELRPDVILMDVSMPILDGVEATRRIHRDNPEINVVMLTMHVDAEVITRALSAGAVGYLVKDSSMSDVVSAVRLAANGDTAVSIDLATSMLSEVHRLVRTPELSATPTHEQIITKREEEVLQLIAEGLSTPEVAASLYISVKTVKNHLASIYAKLDSRDRTQAVVRAVKMGIIHLQ
ncbi:MAG: response regulator transcription factor [Acidimicrobiales bacterium]